MFIQAFMQIIFQFVEKRFYIGMSFVARLRLSF